MIDSSLQCWFFSFIYLFFHKLVRLFVVTPLSRLFMSICTIAVKTRCEGNNSTLTQIPTCSCDRGDALVIRTQF